jgi:hypothetical protein
VARSFGALIFPSCLVLGALLATAAAALHPALAGDGAAQLAVIGRSASWRAIHWAFLFGFPLSLAGLAGLAAESAGTRGERAARAGVIVATFAYACWTVIVAFMAGAGWTLARHVATAASGTEAASAAFLFEMVQPFALATQRVAGFALGVATALLGWGVSSARLLPRWLGCGGVAAGLAAMILALWFSEDTRADQAAFVLPVLWQLVTGVLLLGRRSAAP